MEKKAKKYINNMTHDELLNYTDCHMENFDTEKLRELAIELMEESPEKFCEEMSLKVSVIFEVTDKATKPLRRIRRKWVFFRFMMMVKKLKNLLKKEA